MSELSMSRKEREEFLAALHVGVLAVERPDGPPLVTPIWYRYTAGGAVEFNTSTDSEKAKLLAQAGHASLSAQREELAVRVRDGGWAGRDRADRPATRVDIAGRYLGTEVGTAYVDGSPDADDLEFRLSPTRWRTADFSKLDVGGG